MMPSSNDHHRARPLLGTLVEIQIGGLAEDAAGRAIDAAFSAVEEVQRRMSFHDPESILSRLNRDAAREPVAVDEWTFEVLQAAAILHRVSGGVFDITIAPHLQRLGFLPSETPAADPQPASFADVELLPDRTVRFRHTGVRLDLGGIAKGFAVDQAVAALQATGVPHGLVNAGGDLRAFGERAYPVTIRHPDSPGAALAEIALHENALATSAHYFADRIVPGSEVGPFIEPRTGEASARVRSATVRARSAMLADALTKVVMLAAEDALPSLEFHAADAIFVASDGRAVCSPGWHAALHVST